MVRLFIVMPFVTMIPGIGSVSSLKIVSFVETRLSSRERILSFSRLLPIMLDSSCQVAHDVVHTEFGWVIEFKVNNFVLAPTVKDVAHEVGQTFSLISVMITGPLGHCQMGLQVCIKSLQIRFSLAWSPGHYGHYLGYMVFCISAALTIEFI